MKKGFTLVELMAVILILGVIALIAIPTVNNIISEAKEGATKRSAEEYIRAVEQTATLQEMKGNIITGVKSVSDLEDYVKLKGTKPDSGTVTIENNTVTACTLQIREYSITCNGETIVINKQSGDKVSPQLVVDNNHNGVADKYDKVCIGEECFYVISNDGTKTRMLAEWNLNVGYDLSYNGSDIINDDFSWEWSYNSTYQAWTVDGLTYTKLNPSIIKQDSTKRGGVYDDETGNYQMKGVVSFSPDLNLTGDDYGYWAPSGSLLSKYGTNNPAYVYDSNSNLYSYINSYVETLKSMTGNTNITGNLITYDELISLGCDMNERTCESAPSYVYQTSYWSGAALGNYSVWVMNMADCGFSRDSFGNIDHYGVRPVIEIFNS